MTEEWRPIIDGDYAVSSLGRVRREKPGRKTWPGKIIRSSSTPTGYLTHTLCLAGKPRTYYVHQLVALAFIGPRPIGKDINHKDGVKHHNAYENLEYVSRKENMAHAHAMGLVPKREPKPKPPRILKGRPRGPNHWTAIRLHDVARGEARVNVSKVNTADVLEMRALWKAGTPQVEIAARFKLSKAQTCRIINGTRWGHV